MNSSQAKNAANINSRVRISEHNGWAAGMEGIASGYRASSDKLSVEFVDAEGNPTGESIMVASAMVDKI